jgi:hypothetical protein
MLIIGTTYFSGGGPMSKVEAIILLDGQEFTTTVVEVDSEDLAQQIAVAMSGGLSTGYYQLCCDILDEEYRQTDFRGPPKLTAAAQKKNTLRERGRRD